jgi:hypothetical protein
MLAHIVTVPHEAISLKNEAGKTLVLSLERYRKDGTLGTYSHGHGKRTIHMPDRSNSFAHEWAHALDHWLAQYLFVADGTKVRGLLSRKVKRNGIDPTVSRADRVAEAFVGVIQSLYGDRAKLAALQIDLQLKAAEVDANGKPTPAAKAAQKSLDDIASGKKLPPNIVNRYFEQSSDFDQMVDGKGYFVDPAEMFARAFEAWVAGRASLLSGDLPTNFLTMPNFAYTGSSDAQAQMTYPKEADMDQIAASFEEMAQAMREAAVFGTKGFAKAPEDMNVYDVRHWSKWKPKRGLTKEEDLQWEASARGQMAENEAKAAILRNLQKKSGDTTGEYLTSVYATFFSPSSNYARTLIRREPKVAQPYLTRIADKFFEEPASGRVIKEVWEEAATRVSRQFSTRLGNIMDATKMRANPGVLQNLTEKQRVANQAKFAGKSRMLTELLSYDVNQKDYPQEAISGAANLRRLLNDIYTYAQSAGLKVGYASGYLPRIVDTAVATQDGGISFRTQAAKAYKIKFERDVRAAEVEEQITDLKAMIPRLSRVKSLDAKENIVVMSALTGKERDILTQWRDAVKAKGRLEKALDAAIKEGDQGKIDAAQAKLEEFMENEFTEIHENALDAVERAYSDQSALDWYVRVEIGGSHDFESGTPSSRFSNNRTMPPETDEIMAEFFMGDDIEARISAYITAVVRRAEYVRRVGEGGKLIDDLMVSAAKAAVEAKQEMRPEDIAELRQHIDLVVGGIVSPYSNARTTTAMQSIYTKVTMFLLPMATLASFRESLTLGLKTGKARDGLLAMAKMFGQIARTGDAQERSDLARAIGIVTRNEYETLASSRFGGDLLPSERQRRQLTNYFRLIGLTPLTNVQRTSMVDMADMVLRRWINQALNGNKEARARLADHGIDATDIPSLNDWRNQIPGRRPQIEDMFNASGAFANPASEMWGVAINRFVSHTIQESRRYNRPIAALNPSLRPIYGITGFLFAFHQNVVEPFIKKDSPGWDARGGESAARFAGRRTLNLLKNVAKGALPLTVFSAGVVMEVLFRAALRNEEWLDQLDDDDEEKREEAWDRFKQQLLTRSGLMGKWDMPFNWWTGAKYQRDLAANLAGAHLGTIFGVGDRFVKLAYLNSANNNTAEWNALSAIGNLVIETSTAATLSLLPQSPVMSVFGTAGIIGTSQMNPGDLLADLILGPKGTNYKDIGLTEPPWFEVGD